MNYTDEEKHRGFSVCKTCNECVKLLQAGFDVDTHICSVCKEEVADIDDFKNSDAVDILGK
jgi:cytochrome c2